jgi:hypothetical protein
MFHYGGRCGSTLPTRFGMSDGRPAPRRFLINRVNWYLRTLSNQHHGRHESAELCNCKFARGCFR